MTELTVTSKDVLTKLAVTCESDINVGGWDQPHRLYVIAGTLEDPYLVRLLDIPLDFHPCEVLQQLYDEGRRLRPDALGLALCNEGWRHLNLEETEEIAPDMVKTLREVGRTMDLESDETIDGAINRALHEVQRHVRPSQLPDHLRKETRSVSFVLREGPTFMAMRTRGYDEVDVIGLDPEKGEWSGRIPDFMRQFINGERPHDVPDSEEESNDLPPTGSLN